MRKFNEFNIKQESKSFTGEKIKMSKILNKEITVIDFKIVPSKFTEKGNGNRLDLQIEVNGTKHVVFSGSVSLAEAIQQVPKDGFPFTTTIVEENDRFIFT